MISSTIRFEFLTTNFRALEVRRDNKLTKKKLWNTESVYEIPFVFRLKTQNVPDEKRLKEIANGLPNGPNAYKSWKNRFHDVVIVVEFGQWMMLKQFFLYPTDFWPKWMCKKLKAGHFSHIKLISMEA